MCCSHMPDVFFSFDLLTLLPPLLFLRHFYSTGVPKEAGGDLRVFQGDLPCWFLPL